MGPIVINGSVHTAREQHQRKNIPICVHIVWRVLCELGLKREWPVCRPAVIIVVDAFVIVRQTPLHPNLPESGCPRPFDWIAHWCK